MTDQDAVQVKPTWMWGSSALITFRQNAVEVNSVQLAQIALPEPAVCTIYFQSAIIRQSAPGNQVIAFTINLLQGVGRVTVPRSMTYLNQPATNAPLEVTIPFIPLHALQVNIAGIAAGLGANDELVIETYFTLAPITRIPLKDMPLDFGMELPGEADALDDEMRQELQEDAPSVAAIMEAEQMERLNPTPEPPPSPIISPQRDQLIRTVIARLEQRYQRRPTKQEVRAALNLADARAARRARER